MALSAYDAQKLVVEVTMEHSRLLGIIRLVNATGLGSPIGTVELRHCEEKGEAARGMKERRLVQDEDVSLNIESTRRNSPQPTLIILE